MASAYRTYAVGTVVLWIPLPASECRLIPFRVTYGVTIIDICAKDSTPLGCSCHVVSRYQAGFRGGVMLVTAVWSQQCLVFSLLAKYRANMLQGGAVKLP